MNLSVNMQKEFELEPGEVILLEARKHWFIFTLELLPYAVLAVLPLALPTFLGLAPPLAPYASLIDYREPVMRAVYGIWLLVTWTGAWGTLTRYYLNVWIITNTRIVEITQHHYFDREVSSVLLNRVQDVTTEVAGVLPSLLHIGNISVQSAGAEDVFHMRGIGNPEVMRDLILKEAGESSKSAGI